MNLENKNLILVFAINPIVFALSSSCRLFQRFFKTTSLHMCCLCVNPQTFHLHAELGTMVTCLLQRFRLDSRFSLNPTVFTMSSSCSLHKSSSASCASVILDPFVPLCVKLQAVSPQKELGTKITFQILDPFVRYFTISS